MEAKTKKQLMLLTKELDAALFAIDKYGDTLFLFISSYYNYKLPDNDENKITFVRMFALGK